MSDITGTKAGPCREKYWSEIDTDEKLKRLREHVKYLEKRIERMSKKIDKLEDHHHIYDKIVIPLRYNTSLSEVERRSIGPNPDDVYF